MRNTMDEVETKDLQGWARENKIWKKESWKQFLEDLEKLHFMLTEFWEFHEWLKVTFSNKRISLLSENLKNPGRLIVAGGGRDENAFARMMFKLFSVKAAGADNYEESVAIYEGRGDGTRILVGSTVLGISEDDIKNALRDLEKIIEHFKHQLGASGDFEVPDEDFVEWVHPENPKLIEKLNDFLNLAANMLEPTNPYVLFTRYSNVASLGTIIDFLGCSIEGIKSLAELLGAIIYDSELNPRSIEEINEENLNDLFWLLNLYRGSTRPVSHRILSLLGEDGTVHRIISRVYSDIDVEFGELWEQRFNSLVDLMKSGKWALSAHTRFLFLRYHKWIESVCNYEDYAILFIIPKNCDSITGVEIDVADLSSWYPCHCYSCDCYSKYKMEYPLIVPLEELFPLFATNYLRAQVGESSDCKFLAIRPRSCQGKYKSGEDSYLKLINALGELENEDKAED